VPEDRTPLVQAKKPIVIAEKGPFGMTVQKRALEPGDLGLGNQKRLLSQAMFATAGLWSTMPNPSARSRLSGNQSFFHIHTIELLLEESWFA
jgi:hypothetical protein